MDNLQNILQGLSQEEQAAVIKILTEQSQTGSSVSYNNLIGADYDEVPVSIKEFIESPKYARNYIQTYYPFWKEQLINIFDKGKHYSEIAFTGSIGTGKAQPENAMILGQNGYFRIGDAKVGMKVFGEDGKLHNIVKVWPQGEQPVYKITFNDGTSVECEEDHLWNIRRAGFDSKQRVHLIAEGKGWETKSVRWLLTQNLWIDSDKKDSKGHRQAQRQFYIPVTKPLEFENNYELPIHPYLLGQLIAEGSLTNSINVSIYEQDIREKVDSLLSLYGCYLKVGPEGNEGACEICIKDYDNTKNMSNPIKKIIKELNLNVTATHKHIPKMYLYSSVENRIQLLQGLFDGDGCIQDGQYTYSTSSEQLYNDITFLIESLGGSVYLREGKDSWYTVKDERIYTGNKNWEFYFKFPKSIIPFTSKKHSERFGKGSKFDRTYIFRFIDKIEYVGKKNCLCITTDNPEGLYLTEHCIVTHNSSMAIVGMAYELYKLMCLKNPQKYWGTNKTIFFAFFNNNLDLARSVGFAAFHDLVKKSEWFLDHGEFRGKVHQVYHPYKDIELMAGSLPSHVIGKDVFCLTGDTKVVTDKGIFRIDELAKLGLNDLFRVKQVANNGELVWSNKCLARQTKIANDLLRIIFEDNTSVKCTPDHLFLSEDLNYSHGYDLNPNDYVYAFNNTSCRLKIKAIERIYSECGEPVYDIICAYPFNNFAVYLSDDFMIFPHNCALQDELNFAKNSNMHMEQSNVMLTYNCVTGDTIIKTSEGYVQVKDLVGKRIKTYCLDLENQKYYKSNSCDVICAGTRDELYEIEFENGVILKCTGEHRLMLTDGSYKYVKDLTTDDDIMEVTNYYGYVYETTNKINGKKYIGQHKGCFDLRYLGSGEGLKRAIKKYGPHSFETKVLAWAYSADQLNQLEIQYLNDVDAIRNPNYYNHCNGNCRKLPYSSYGGTKGKKAITDGKVQKFVSVEEVPKYIEKGWRLRPKKSIKGYKFSNVAKQNMAMNHANFSGLNHPNHKSKQGNRVWMNDGKNNRFIHTNEVNKYIDEGWEIGIIPRDTSKNGRKNKGRVHIHKNDKCIAVYKDELNSYLDDGWILGSVPNPNRNKNHIGRHNMYKGDKVIKVFEAEIDNYSARGYKLGTGHSTHNLGKICVNNGTDNKFIFKEELDDYISSGWSIGRLSKSRKEKL